MRGGGSAAPRSGLVPFAQFPAPERGRRSCRSWGSRAGRAAAGPPPRRRPRRPASASYGPRMAPAHRYRRRVHWPRCRPPATRPPSTAATAPDPSTRWSARSTSSAPCATRSSRTRSTTPTSSSARAGPARPRWRRSSPARSTASAAADRHPCGECESCLPIAAGTSIDVIEMDAASNRSVDDVRDLRERVAYAPGRRPLEGLHPRRGPHAHQEAWNAFLKTLEEPPPNTVFVLATTESHKVIATIADRCQRFDFQRPSLEQISEVLERVAEAEGIEIEPGDGDGRPRRLGQLPRCARHPRPDRRLRRRAGRARRRDRDARRGRCRAALRDRRRGDRRRPGASCSGSRGWPAPGATRPSSPATCSPTCAACSSPRRSARCRDLRRHRHRRGPAPGPAAAIGAADLVRTIDELAAALTAVREGDDARLAVEVALLKAARPDVDPSAEGLLRRVERLEKGIGGRWAAGPVGG